MENIEDAIKEAGRVFAEGEELYPQWIMETPEATYYTVSDRRYFDVPTRDTAVAKVSTKGTERF